jgi:hypothetical protein
MDGHRDAVPGGAGPAEGGRGGVLARRRRTVLGAVAVTTLLCAGGLIGASWVKSPAEVEAETSPPSPSVITAPVVRQVLATTVVMRGTFSPGSVLSISPSSVAATAGNPGGGGLVVTGMYARPGDAVHSGQLLAEVSDRPVFVLPGRLPMWRDLVPGESGKDVAELQSALAGLGYSSAPDDAGSFGSGTEAAVQAFYLARGYQPALAQGQAGDSPAAVRSAAPSPGPSSSPGSGSSSPQVMVPMSEVWFVPRLPAYVASVSAQVGGTVSGALITLTPNGLVLQGQLDPAQAQLVKPGMAAQVLSQVSGYSGSGSVTSVGSQVTPQSGASQGVTYYPVAITPDGDWPRSLNGQNVQITITAASTRVPVLAVPVAAVSSDASGLTTVTVTGSGGRPRLVRVSAHVSANGYVEVIPLRDGSLEPGDRVVVGQ